MYSTCLFCSRDLGANDVIDTLPIGRRVAFDSDTGRLWVVCRGCEKWNLVPFESRLETIDACERLFRDAKLKFSTDNIGIARLREGLELVRIGPAQRPEFAAWRYGDQFGRRRKSNYVKVVAGVALVGGLGVLRHTLAPWLMLPVGTTPQIVRFGRDMYRNRRVVTTVRDPDGSPLVITRAQARSAVFTVNRDKEMTLEIGGYERARAGFATEFGAQYVTLKGDNVLPALGHLLPHVNAAGASRATVTDAVDMLAEQSSAAGILSSPATDRMPAIVESVVGRFSGMTNAQRLQRRQLNVHATYNKRYQLISVPSASRLAMEMLAHETSERAALAGELKLLERQWKEADRVAKISDDLVLDET